MSKHAPEKLTKDFLKNDPLIDWVLRGMDFVHRHRTRFLAGSTGLLLLVAGAVGWKITSQHWSEEQAKEFFDAENIYYGIQLSQEERARLSKGAFQAFVENHPRAALTPYAWMYLGRLAREENNLKDMEAAYRQVIDHGQTNDDLLAQALSGLASMLIDKKDFSGAKDLLEKIPDGYQDLKHFQLGQLELASGNTAQAREHLLMVTQQEKGSALKDQAQATLDNIP
ncbi:MAG: tetratricopeptide repeat protein [Deltaproteobacteria bacterium]|nr:tetratricopeptide repeat protein [Deltaproteobacteria bacterium]